MLKFPSFYPIPLEIHYGNSVMAMGPKVAVKFAFENPGQLNQRLYIARMME